MSQQTSSQSSVCSGFTGAYAEPVHAMAYFLPAAFLYNPHVPKEPVSFFYSQDIEEVLGQGPHGPPSSHTTQRIPSHDLLPTITT